MLRGIDAGWWWWIACILAVYGVDRFLRNAYDAKSKKATHIPTKNFDWYPKDGSATNMDYIDSSKGYLIHAGEIIIQKKHLPKPVQCPYCGLRNKTKGRCPSCGAHND